jgi:hypothetical protein
MRRKLTIFIHWFNYKFNWFLCPKNPDMTKVYWVKYIEAKYKVK